MSTVNGVLLNVAKNKMLNDWRVQGFSATATNAANSSRSNSVAVNLGTASNGKTTMPSPITLVIQSGSTGNDAIKKIFLFITGAGFPAGQNVEFELATAIEFPDGGSLVINTLEISLDDPA